MIFSPRTGRALAIALVAAAALAAADVSAPGAWTEWTLIGLGAAVTVATLVRAHGAPRDAAPGALAVFGESLWLGITGFGGGLAVLSQIERRVVGARRWITSGRFLECAALGQSLPGAISVNTLMFVGHDLAGPSGALAGLVGFVLPSFLLMVAFAIGYGAVRQQPLVDAAFLGLNAAVVGLVAATTVRLAGRLVPRGARRAHAMRAGRWDLAIAAAVALAVSVLGMGVVEAILAAGLIGLLRASRYGPDRLERALAARWRAFRGRAARAARERRRWRDPEGPAGPLPALLPASAALNGIVPGLVGRADLLLQLGGVFLRAGAITLGGGYVIIPLLEAELVRQRGWLTARAFSDAMALGQVTPGPVVIAATFVGARLAGATGAMVATAAVFLPSFVLVLVVAASVERFRRSALTQAFLAGLRPAVVGLLAAASVSLWHGGVRDLAGALIALVSFALLWRTPVSAGLVMLGAAILGLALRLVARI